MEVQHSFLWAAFPVLYVRFEKISLPALDLFFQKIAAELVFSGKSVASCCSRWTEPCFGWAGLVALCSVTKACIHIAMYSLAALRVHQTRDALLVIGVGRREAKSCKVTHSVMQRVSC